MDYEELYELEDFQRNMRRTAWLKLFPHWWSENDALLNAIGDEVERVKAQAIFALLNAGSKPPVLLWQDSLIHEDYQKNFNITRLPSSMDIRAPFYKTWGYITLTNNTEDDIDGLEITFDGENGFAINQSIKKSDKIKINLYDNTVSLNNKKIYAQKIGEGMPYFITSQNNEIYDDNTPLHNEIVRLKINTDTELENTTIINNINVTEKLDNWIVQGNAYQYNKAGADPWIALEPDTRIGYELNLNKINNISFWYKGDDNSRLICYCDNKQIFDKKTNAEWQYYSIDTTDMLTPGKLEFEHLSENGTIYINDIKYEEEDKYSVLCDIDINVNMDNVVFINEQNIEVTGLELIPIERIELYAKYDFDYNTKYNGWKKVYQKKYDKNTNVVYDMITTHFFTKEFYVDVWFKTLQYPYKVGFPAYKDADIDSMYHVNNKLDGLGDELGLERRLYKENIDEKDYPTTFPIYYPFDIEQDYWYYQRLINEYTWNEYAINDIDIVDKDGNNVLHLYSINPFCEDFVVHAKSIYPTVQELVDYSQYIPSLITQQNSANNNQQVGYDNIINLLTKDDNYATITLNNNSNNNDVIYKKRVEAYRNYTEAIDLTDKERNYLRNVNLHDMQNGTNVSKELITYFDLSDLPEDINIENIEVIVEGNSADNKTDKFTTANTGLLIPSFNSSKESFIPLTPDIPYQTRKKNVTFSNNNFIKHESGVIDGIKDKNVVQVAFIGEIQTTRNKHIQIPFTLKENDVEVPDINEVYLYFDNVIKTAQILNDEQIGQYIECALPRLPIFSQITIVTKSAKHSPFTVTIDVQKENKMKYVDKENQREVIMKTTTDVADEPLTQLYYVVEDGEDELITHEVELEQQVDYQYVAGPITEEVVGSIEVVEEWRTGDLRNLLQRQGIFFRHILENDNPQSSTSVFLYNISLKISYSPKQPTCHLKTKVDIHDAQLPDIGTYYISVENTGTKALESTVDIFAPPNISLSKTSIPIYVRPHESYPLEPITIKANYPIIDGFYEILAMCEDKTSRNSVSLFSDGLIKTSVTVKPHHGKYYENITLKAQVQALDGSKIHNGVNQLQFYINGYAVGDVVTVKNNKAEVTITPGNYSFTDTGILKLEAHFLGTNKYASSRGQSTIFISKNSTRITIEAPDKAIYNNSYEAKAKVEYFDGEQYLPVNDGAVEFLINEEILGLSNTNDEQTFANGYFTVHIDKLENPIGDYKLSVRYVGSKQYASVEAEKSFEIIGGTVSIFGYEEVIKPHDTVQLKAKFTDSNYKDIPYGYADFKIQAINKEINNVPVKDGIAVTPKFTVDIDVTDNETKILDVEIQYHTAQNDGTVIYNDSNNRDNLAHIIVRKSTVYFEYPSIYKCSQYEPLGFWVKVVDAETGEYVKNGNIKITLPYNNYVSTTSEVDDDGIARLIYKPITFSAKEWSELNKFKFTTANYNQNLINIVNDTNIPDTDIQYDASNLYKIYDGNKIDISDENNNNTGLVNFEYDNNNLYIVGTGDDGRQIKEHVYIGENGCIYSRSTFDDLRIYKTGLQNIIINYSDNEGQYVAKEQVLTNILNITKDNIDLDIHSYDLHYTDKDNIICYATQYSHSNDFVENTPSTLINTGSVEFFIDDASMQSVKVQNGIAQFNNDDLILIPAGRHLMRVQYTAKDKALPTTNSYSYLQLRQSTPIIDMYIDKKVKGRKANIVVTVTPDNDKIPLNGVVNLYMNDEVIDTQYIYGNETIDGIVDYEGSIANLNIEPNAPCVRFIITLPEDLDVNEYTFDAEYLGNEFFESVSTAPNKSLKVKQEPTSVKLVLDNDTIYVGEQQECVLDIDVLNTFNSVDSSNDVINEGTVTLYDGNNQVIAHHNVLHSHAQLKWQVGNKSSKQYILKYENGINYKHLEDNKEYKIITIKVIDALSTITIPNEYCTTLNQALMCLKPNGTIIIKNKDFSNIHIYKTDSLDLSNLYEIEGLNISNLHTKDFLLEGNELYYIKDDVKLHILLTDKNKFYTSTPLSLKDIATNTNNNVVLTRDINIDKDCNIIGVNNACIIKDAVDLVSNFDNIHIYETDALDFSNLHEIEGLSILNLNTNDFLLEDNELYYIKDGVKLQILLTDKNKFYASTPLSLKDINTNTNININENANVHFDNIIFKSNDNTDNTDFVINNNGQLTITHSVLTSSVFLVNAGELRAQRNLMYCTCAGGGDLNNNWWGSNTAPYEVDTNIILQLTSVDSPAVISEEVNIIAGFIGSNGREYDLPPVEFKLSSDTGYFSIDNGMLVNNKVQTTYLDAEKEGNIYFTVDDETISYEIYDYARKTEIIFDDITEVPINYQATIHAKVQSCADTYYVFDKDNKVTKSSETINSGYITFYIDNAQVGYSKVQDGQASVTIYFNTHYDINTTYNLKAVYTDDYYFTSNSNIDIHLIKERDNNNIYYVSAENGNDNNNGLYSNPVKTIQYALDNNADIIYLLDDIWTETNINVTHNATIKAYNHTTFKNLTGTSLFNISADAILNLKKIDFVNNSFTNLFNNQGIAQLRKCIIYNNKNTVFKTTKINAEYCAIVDNDNISPALSRKGDCFAYCWFGTNNPKTIDKNIDKNIIMTTSQSKDVIYIGTVVHITAELKYYQYNDDEYLLRNSVPLRIAKFATEYGSMKPTKDYTYHNKSTSLLNTLEDNNTRQYILTLPDNNNYLGHTATVSCYVQDVQGNNVTSTIIGNKDIQNVKMHIYNNITNKEKVVMIQDGVASTTIGKLPLGTYNIDCSYEKDGQLYTTTGSFTVRKPQITVTKCNIIGDTNLYHTYIDATLKDNFGNDISKSNFNIYVDGQFITSYFSTNSKIQKAIAYTLLEEGQHVLTINNKDIVSDYDTFEYNNVFTVKSQSTKITFDYNKIEAKVNNKLTIEILDEENNHVQGGTVSVEFDNQTVTSDVPVDNGIVTLSDFKVDDIGQYSIAIYYSGMQGYYKESVKVRNIGVGIFPVTFGINDNIYADIGYNFNFTTTIKDVAKQSVNHGYVNLYIDDVMINDDIIIVNDGIINYNEPLPNTIAPGQHTFKIEYIDNMNIYLDTVLDDYYLIIGKIPTTIAMEDIHGSPGEMTTIEYTIATSYGDAKDGTLIALYDDIVIGQSVVTDSIINQISIKVPFLPAIDDYQITFMYHDDNQQYADSTTQTRLVIVKNTINIKPSHTWYYPNQTFHFGALFTDNDNNIINVGKAALYIDNVKETESIDVVNGAISIPLQLTKARIYPMTIVYEDNDYYQQSTYPFEFKVDSIDIQDIYVETIENTQENVLFLDNNIIHSLPNQNAYVKLAYDTLYNYNVKDGIVDILIDGNTVGSYYVAESNKYISFNIGDLDKGVHEIAFNYHDSTLFNDASFKHELNIISQTLDLTITNAVTRGSYREISTRVNDDTITIDTFLSKEVNGLLKYYIGLPIYRVDDTGTNQQWTYDYRFIGLVDINQKQDISYDYTLSPNLLSYAEDKNETLYKIKVLFEGNNQYDSAEDEVNLHIKKNDCSITFNTDNPDGYVVEYRDILDIQFNIDAQGEQLVILNLNGVDIGTILTSDGRGHLEYQMTSDLIASQDAYVLTAHFNGSALNNPTDAITNVQVVANTPKINSTILEAYKGGDLIVDNILTDSNGVVVTSGTIQYKIYNENNELLLTSDEYKPNKQETIALPIDALDNQLIAEIIYNSSDATKYNSFTKRVNLILKKNDIIINATIPNDIYRGEEFIIDIEAISSTTKIPVDVDISYKRMEDI